jgi:hypothetical protein
MLLSITKTKGAKRRPIKEDCGFGIWGIEELRD